MTIKFLPQARAELMDAVEYYEGELSGLGYRFREEVDEHVSWIERNREVPRLRPGGYRRVNRNIFPYYISYIVRDSVIWILAVAHGHSRPEYWIDRPGAVEQRGEDVLCRMATSSVPELRVDGTQALTCLQAWAGRYDTAVRNNDDLELADIGHEILRRCEFM